MNGYPTWFAWQLLVAAASIRVFRSDTDGAAEAKIQAILVGFWSRRLVDNSESTVVRFARACRDHRDLVATRFQECQADHGYMVPEPDL
jgi:hypothetical protein